MEEFQAPFHITEHLLDYAVRFKNNRRVRITQKEKAHRTSVNRIRCYTRNRMMFLQSEFDRATVEE